MTRKLAPRKGHFRFSRVVSELEIRPLVEKLGWQLWLCNEAGPRERNMQLYASDKDHNMHVVATRLMRPRVFNSDRGIEGWLDRYLFDVPAFNLPRIAADNTTFTPFPLGRKLAELDEEDPEKIVIPRGL